MLKELTAANIYIVCGHTDMRKSIDGLAAIVQQQFDLDLFSDSLFLFCGRRRDRLKALLWEGDGFLLFYKRLENGRFNWPRSEQEVRNLTREQFVWLMQGLSVDQPKAIKGGLFHPRCKDSTSTYFEGITNIQPMTDEEMAEMERREKLEQKESYYKNQAEKNRRIAEHSLDGENKRTYSHRAEVFEQKAQNAEKALAKSGKSGIINLFDNSTDYKPVTQEAIDSVPLLNVFDDDAMNKAHQEACRDLLREVRKHDELPLGTEFSIVYDENMQPIKGCGYRQGAIGKTKIDNPGIPYHAFHNHGSGQTFSYPDLLGFVRQDNMLSLTALGNNNNQFILLSSGIQSKVHYAEYIRTKAQEALTEIDGVLITLQNIYHQPVFDMIRQMGDKNRRLLEKLVVKKTEECLVGAEKHGIKYLSFKT